MSYEIIETTPIRIEKMSVIDGIPWAFSPAYEELELALGQIESLNDIDSCSGVLLDRIGQIVCLSRQEAGIMIGSRELADDDSIYRVCLKYKAYVNSCRCTPDEIIEATKLFWGFTGFVQRAARHTSHISSVNICAFFRSSSFDSWISRSYRSSCRRKGQSGLFYSRYRYIRIC